MPNLSPNRWLKSRLSIVGCVIVTTLVVACNAHNPKLNLAASAPERNSAPKNGPDMQKPEMPAPGTGARYTGSAGGDGSTGGGTAPAMGAPGGGGTSESGSTPGKRPVLTGPGRHHHSFAHDAVPAMSEATKLPSVPLTAKPAVPQTVIQPLPQLSHQTVFSAVDDVMNTLVDGRVEFNPPPQMKIGESTTLEARITADLKADISKNLVGDGKPVVAQLKVGPYMKSTLTSGADEFRIDKLSSDEQPVGMTGYTSWAWQVTPLRSGKHKLSLLVSVVLNIPNHGQEEKSYLVYERDVTVVASPGYTLGRFMNDNWKYIFGTLTLPVILALIKKGNAKTAKSNKPRARRRSHSSASECSNESGPAGESGK